MDDDLEQLWAQLLSCQSEHVWEAYNSLTKNEQQFIYAHLLRMANETGWHPEQRRSAQAALQILSMPPNI